METDEINETNLYYTMLEYIFKQKAVNSSCFGHCWEKFRSNYSEFQSIASSKLFTIFSYSSFLSFTFAYSKVN